MRLDSDDKDYSDEEAEEPFKPVKVLPDEAKPALGPS